VEEGQFRFSNGAVINEGISNERIGAVIEHEFTHALLYSNTTYGQIILMLEKNSMFSKKSNEYTEVLFSYMSRMQERVAVNVEVMSECCENGYEAYNGAIEELKNRNRTYYNFFRKLCCINGKIRKNLIII
jgi:spore germination protein YaaH